jgi:hypothetical protein
MKNKILWFITYSAIFLFWTSLATLSLGSKPLLTFLLSLGWIVVFYFVNWDKLKSDTDE